MSNSLKEYLKAHEVSKDQPYTHTSLNHDTLAGKYNISNNTKKFHKIYAEHVFEKKKACFLSEKHMKDYGKICIDLDLRYDLATYQERVYTDKLWRDLVEAYQDALQEITGETCQEEELFAYVMEKDHAEVDEARNVLKDGIHVMFPYLCISYKAAHYARKKVIEKMRDHPELTICSNTVEQIIDESVVERNNWMMYGARKNDNAQAYKITNIVDGDGDSEYDLPEENVDLLLLLSIQNRVQEHPTIIDKIEKDAKEAKNKREAVIMAANVAMLTDNLNCDVDTGRPKKTQDYLKALLGLLSDERKEDYTDWFKIGAILYNEGEENLEMWKEWSSSSTKYNSGHCDKLWSQTFSRHSSERKVRIGSLQMMAQQDSPREYFRVISKYEKQDELIALIKKSTRNTHSEFAELTNYLLKNKYKYSKEKWYCYENNRWRALESAIPLMQDISKTVKGVLMNYEMILSEQILRLTAEQESTDKLEDEKTRLGKTITCLKNHSYKTAVVNECKEFFYDEEFFQKLDMNIYLIGFNNGTYDLRNGLFRESRPEDMISYTTGFDYSDKINKTVRAEILDLFQKSLPDKSVREYMLFFLGSSLIGGNKNELFVNLEGSGGNGKGVISTLHDYALGDYYGTLDNSYLTNVSSSQEGHNSKLISVFKKRYVQVNEPPKGKFLNLDYIKELSGNDKMQVRKAHCPEPELSGVPMFVMAMLCNKMPKIDDAHDGGFLRRYKGINFPNRFVSEPKRETEFRADPNLKTKLKEDVTYRQQYMNILLEYVRKYMENDEKMPVSKVIDEHSRMLVQQFDHYTDFIDTCLTVTEDKNDVITVKDLFMEFKEFYRDYQSGSGRLPNNNQMEFIERMKKCFAATSVTYRPTFVDTDGQRMGKVFLGVKVNDE